MASRFDTHEVFNQPPPLAGYSVFGDDVALAEALEREGGAWARDELQDLGIRAGSVDAQELGRQANQNPPVLHTHDRYGNRIDEVRYHPAYHELMRVAVGHGLHAAPWADDRVGAHVARAAKIIVWYQVDGGHICPISMTYSVVPALRHAPDIAQTWEPRLTTREYDPSNRPAGRKAGATCGMAMTEKQGGSDVRANTTVARPVADGFVLTGHKWFCSAPMSDAFLMLAQAPKGLSCFLVPRWLPDGSRNPIRIQRLKDKLGDRSNASSEIELVDTMGSLVGEEGRGVRTIIEMVNHTRLDCVLGSTSIMRQGVAQATWHTHYRAAFGAPLDEQPLMTNVLADLVLESEGATAAALRLARAFEADAHDEHEQMIKRLVTPMIKYWTCKRAPQHAAEALECLGGAGYVEESDLPRLFRQSPLNGVWEGSGNVICLDVLRAIAREPAALEAYWDEVSLAGGSDRRLDESIAKLRTECEELEQIETRARRLVERLAIVFQAALLVRHAPPPVADAFCASRLAGDTSHAFGAMAPGLDMRSIIERARPHLRRRPIRREIGRYLSGMEIECADCGCIVDRGVRLIPCETSGCCCTDLATVEPMETMAGRIRIALNARDMSAFRALVAEGATWGDGGPDDERTCHNRNEIIATYKRLLAEGVRGTVIETTTGRRGVACTLEVDWPESAPNRRGPTIYQAFFVADGLVTRIVGHDDRDGAVGAISD